MAEMTHRRSRYIVAVEDHRLVGIVSIGDVVKSQLEDRELEVRCCETSVTPAPERLRQTAALAPWSRLPAGSRREPRQQEDRGFGGG